MARIRTIKPEFWRNEGLSRLAEATHLLAAALLNYADDEGYFNANPKLVAAECSPLREPSVTIPASLLALSEADYLVLGKTPDGREYGRIVKFRDHQVINKPTPSKIKALPIEWERSVPTTVVVPEASRAEQGTGNRERKRKGKTPPKGGSAGEMKEVSRDEVLEALTAYNVQAQAHGWAVARTLLTERERALKRRLVEFGLPAWKEAMTKAGKSSFLNGSMPKSETHRNWKPDLGFFLQVSSLTKVLEGKYDDVGGKPASPTGGFAAVSRKLRERGDEQQSDDEAGDERTEGEQHRVLEHDQLPPQQGRAGPGKNRH